MNPTRRDLLKLAAAAIPAAPWSASAQARYPSRPISIVVPATAGGQADAIARFLGQSVSSALGQPIIVENMPGASGIIGMRYAANKPADGYTIVYGTGSWLGINPSYFANLPYDSVKDFSPITEMLRAPQCLMLGPSVSANNLAELIALAKARPGHLTFASFGSGSSSHLQGELLKQTAGIDMLHVPYRGSAQAITELIAGRVDMYIIDFAPAVEFIKAGRVRGLAVTGGVRYPMFPDIPTFTELGYPLTLVGSNGLLAPAGTPQPIVQLLSDTFNKVIQSPAGKEKLLQFGGIASGSTPEAYRRSIVEDIPKWRDIIVKAGLMRETL